MTGDTARAACPRFRSAEQNKRLELKNVSRREAYKNYYGYLSCPGANLSLLVGRWTSIAEAKPSEADQRKEKKSRKGKKSYESDNDKNGLNCRDSLAFLSLDNVSEPSAAELL